jgi:GntR family transcriptional regulator
VSDTMEPEVIIRGGASIEVQLRSQIRNQILNGILRPGEELPSVRLVAVELAFKPNIIERVYRDLEHEGVLNSEEGSRVLGGQAALGSGLLKREVLAENQASKAFAPSATA